ncbi:MAG TPA: hypothetical protein DCW83_14525 [Saprospirales bacterium]|nr:hypothetical protein [Saprospirales bacterium]HAW05898.1 hypothetical protein [Saprospirales bacterium]
MYFRGANNFSLKDPMEVLNIYSLAHLLIWLFVGRLIFKSWRLFFLLSLSWELLELVLPYGFAIESWINKVSDILVNTIGYYIGLLWKSNKDRSVKY